MNEPPIVTPSGIQISYKHYGEQEAPAIILIMGLGASMNVWPEGLIHGLVKKGFRVILFDNRDVGRSTHLDEHGSPSIITTWLNVRLRRKVCLPYQLDDMAEDVIALMGGLQIKKAHFVGVSMGGMIAQILASKYKNKALSLTSIMSTTNALPRPTLKVMLNLARRPSVKNAQAVIRYNMKLNRLIGGRKYASDEPTLYRQAVKNTQFGYNPAGIKRQLAAITASHRHNLVTTIKVPTLVIHGSEDPVIRLKSGQASADVIRKAKLKIVNGMGHSLPDALASKLTKWISKHVSKAEKKRRNKKRKKQPLIKTKFADKSR